MKIVKRIIAYSLILCLIGITGGFIYYIFATKNIQLDPKRLTLQEQNIILLDSKQNPILLGLESKNQCVASEEIPQHTKQAFIDVEDKRFYRHNGFDVKGIARAIWHNTKSLSFKEGASTISQQLIKNSHLSQEKTLKRKLQEWKLTKQLEKKYGKEEILAKYLNTIYFGHSCFGIASASEFYFNKQVNQLSLSESAMLAGMVKSPNNYSPFRHPEECLKRRNFVLRLMNSHGSISDEETEEAISVPLPVQLNPENSSKSYPYFVLDELAHLSEIYNFRIGGKIQIQTFMDKNLQGYMEKLNNEDVSAGKAFLSLDPKSGGFKACISSIGNAPRLPGSLLKPLLVYTPALEENYLAPATPILDEKIDYNGYSPKNYDENYHGYVSARECVEKSLNIPAVKVLSSMGIEKCTNYLEKLNLRVNEEDKSLALALGGMKHGYKLTELLAAYSVFPNEGMKTTCGFIESIAINGKTVYKKPKNAQKVFSPESTYLMTDMLKSAAQNGTAKKLRELPFEIAAKTGTAGTKNGNTDAYALSYTTKDCLAVWVGNADNGKTQHTGGGLPCNYLKKLNEYLYKEYKKNNEYISSFTQPKNIVKIQLDKPAYYDTHTIMRADENAPAEYRFSELFKKDAIPLKQSTSFTFPSILQPSLSFNGNEVIIALNPHSPTYYNYRIERSDYATHTIIYEGEFIPTFIDNRIENEKKYTYTVTPIYKNTVGKTIILPTVYTTQKNNTLVEDRNILDREWWSN